MQAAFRGRKHNLTENVMVAVDFDIKFTYVLTSWEGSVHDALILADAIERNDGFTVPEGFGIDQVVTPEEGFTSSQPDPLDNLPNNESQSQDSNAMALRRNAIAGAGAAAAASIGVAGAGVAIAAAGAGAAAGGPRAMRWNNNTSGFVLRRMAHLVSDGSRPDKVFKDKDVNHVAKALKEYSGEAVSPTQVYNHLRKWRQKRSRVYKLRKWRQKWSRVYKLKNLSGALWDSDTNAIMLEQEHYLGHCKDQPKDAGCSSKATELLSSAMGGKRKRGIFSEDEKLMLINMPDVVNNVANALSETRPAHVDVDLYLAVMEMPSFTEEALIVAYTYMLDNKAQGRSFVGMSDSHRNIWLRNYLAKNYYM
ncbi:uncharacterized protein [Miscanthus floridulus]|uniref:uncharacterized protein n=1 Tax=Miscanthus floridulus TaxID=154761 RepID=UPI0034592973